MVPPVRQRLRRGFHEELRATEEAVLGGIDLVLGQLDRTLEAVAHQDCELAGLVIADDDRIDGRFLEVHQAILSLLVRQSPVAGDLRLVAALLHAIKHVERMGDQCVDVAKLLPLTGWQPPVQPAILERVLRMGQSARDEVALCRRAFEERNVELAADLVRQDRVVNRLNREIFAAALELGTDPDVREWAMTMVLVARALERIGDNAVDVGEQVVFVVTGRYATARASDRAPA